MLIQAEYLQQLCELTGESNSPRQVVYENEDTMKELHIYIYILFKKVFIHTYIKRARN
jgi:hypothetical protein